MSESPVIVQREGAVATVLLRPEVRNAFAAAAIAALQNVSPQALAAAKRLLAEVAHRPLGDALQADTAERIAQARASADGREGINAFLAKRKPNWIDPEAR